MSMLDKNIAANLKRIRKAKNIESGQNGGTNRCEQKYAGAD